MADNDEKIVSLVPRQADQETVQALEILLNKARNGELTGIAIVGLCDDGYIVEQYTSGILDQVFTAVGVLRYLEQRLLDKVER